MRASRMAAVAVQCGLLCVPIAARAATRSYPGVAPCNGTLQACIDGATAGDRIELTTPTQIAEDLTIVKSLTLTSAAGVTGFVGGELVPQDVANLHTITINETPSGPAVAVVLSALKITANINVEFSTGSGHSFAVQRCQLVRPFGDSDLPLMVHTWAHVPATFDVSDNLFNASDTSVFVQTDAGASDLVTVNVMRNQFLGDAISPESSSAVHLEMDTGQVHANIWSNLVHRNSAGAEGWAFSVSHNDYFGTTVGGVIDITGNTVDFFNNAYSYGMLVNVPDAVQINLYDNIFGHMPVFGGEGTKMDARGNDFFAIDYLNLTQLTNPGLQFFDDPGYVNPGAGDFRLSSTSALINAGFNAAPGGMSATDLDGNPRIAEGTVDIGAFEFTPAKGGEAGAGGESGEAGANSGGSGVVSAGTGGLGSTAGTPNGGTGGATTTMSGGSAGTGGTGGSNTSSGGSNSAAGEPGSTGGAPNGGSSSCASGSGGAASNSGKSDSGCSIRGATHGGTSSALLFLAALGAVWARRRKKVPYCGTHMR